MTPTTQAGRAQDAAVAVVQRWTRARLLWFGTRDDGSDDLLLAAEIIKAVRPIIEAEARAAGAREAYADRNLVAQAFAWAMEEAGWPVAWGVDESEPDWPVLYIETPQGQVSWHIPKAERIYEPPVRPEHGPVAWDGHTKEQKFERLRAALREREGREP